MRVNLVMGFLVMLVFNLFAASKSSGQSIHEVKIDFCLESELDLRSALMSLQQETGYTLFFPTEKLAGLKAPKLNARNKTLAGVLHVLLKDSGLSYQQTGNKSIAIFQELTAATPANTVVGLPDPVLQLLTVEGIVLDENGEPLSGVTVVIKNWRELGSSQQTSTATDKNGHWSLRVPSESTVIVVSLLGYKKQEITVGKTRSFRIKMETDTSVLADVVVTGLYSRPEQNFTGAATIITKEQLSKVTNGNVLNALSTLDPSFQIPENIDIGSNPNVLQNVQVRGGNSVVNPSAGNTNDVFDYTNSNVNTPLFILDGFEVSLQRISDLDINRVASVTLLKDAAATSIYGSRAANGVVIMETIKPLPGKLNVSFNSNLTIEVPDLTSYDLLNAAEKLDLEVQAGRYRSASQINSTQENLDILYAARKAEVEKGVNTYWLSQPLQTSVGTKQNLYVEGGDNNILYGVGLTYDKRNGVMKGSNRETTQGNSYLQYKTSKLTVRNDFNIYLNKANNSPYGTFDEYALQNPYYTPFNDDGSLKYYLEDINLLNESTGGVDLLSQITNPMYNSGLNVIDKTSYVTLMDNINVLYQAKPWLRLNGRLSLQKQTDKADRFLPATHTDFAELEDDEFNKKGSYTYSEGSNFSMDGNFTADINKSWGKHMVYSTIGTSFRTNESEISTVVATGFPNQRLSSFYNAIQYAENSTPTGYESISRLVGFLGNLSYAYDNRYLVDLSYRLDGSSLFGANNRFANFWAVGGGWNIHNEGFWSNNDVVDLLKLRYSFGYTGSQSFASYLANTTARYYNDRNYVNQIGLYLLGFGNENLSWQETQKQNFGLDLTLFKRVDLRANYFIEKTKGALATVNTAPSTGFSSYQENLGDLLNKGWEAYLNVRLYNKGRDNVSVFLNAFSAKGEYVKISNSLRELNRMADTSSSTVPLIRYEEGMSPTAIWAVRSKGIDPSNGREIFLTRNGELTNEYSNLDQVIVGDTRADVEGTFGTNVEIKGIGLNAYFRFRMGGQVYNQTLADRVENVDIANNVDRRVYEGRWLQPGDHTFFKGLVNPEGYSISNSPTYPTSRFVQDYNYLALENMSVYYRFSDQLNRKLRLSSSRINFYTGQLFRLSTVKQERGLSYPFSRTFTVLLQVSF